MGQGHTEDIFWTYVGHILDMGHCLDKSWDTHMGNQHPNNDSVGKAVSSRVMASMHPIVSSVMHRHRVHEHGIDSSKGIELPVNALNYPAMH